MPECWIKVEVLSVENADSSALEEVYGIKSRECGPLSVRGRSKVRRVEIAERSALEEGLRYQESRMWTVQRSETV